MAGPVEWTSIGAEEQFAKVWRECLSRCDAAWPIAPETGGILERLCQDVESAGIALLTCPSAAVRLAASKLATALRLSEFGLPVVPTFPLSTWKPAHDIAFVIKPDDGAGCEGARIIHDLSQSPLPAELQAWIAQPLIEGESLSLSALFAAGRARLLSVNRQRIQQSDGGFTLRGCEVNALADPKGDWQALAASVARALPELWGYAGIDLILTAGGPVILEINPRLTTSYAGLRQATGENPAALTLDLYQTGRLPAPRGQVGEAVEVLLE
jgi:predicted ATP-grasp superfamily ATP-dependent carboligase